MIEVANISKIYTLGKTKVEALHGLDLSIEKGGFVCIMGPSGSGKSTLLNIIGCLDRPDSGSVKIDSEEVTVLTRDQLAEIRAHKIGFIFQSFNLIPVLNVYENIEFPLFLKTAPVPEKEKKEWILYLIDEVGLSEYISHKPDELSGGQRQRVAIARALVTRPDIVLADEPTANLDSKTSRTILELLKKLNQKEKTTFVFATHDPDITPYASRLCRLMDGTVKDQKQ